MFCSSSALPLQETLDREADYELRGSEMYVRVEVMSSAGKMLFTQPIYDDTQFIAEIQA